VEETAPVHEPHAGPEPEPASLPDAARFPDPEPYELPDLDASAHIATLRFDPGADRPSPSHSESDPQHGHPASRLSGLRSLLLGIDSLRTRTATMTPPEEESQTPATPHEREPGDLRPIVNPFTENWSPFSEQMPSGISVKPEFSPLRPAETPGDLDRASRSNWIEIPAESDDPFKRP